MGSRTQCNIFGLASLDTAGRAQECSTPSRTAGAWRQQDSPWAIFRRLCDRLWSNHISRVFKYHIKSKDNVM